MMPVTAGSSWWTVSPVSAAMTSAAEEAKSTSAKRATCPCWDWTCRMRAMVSTSSSQFFIMHEDAPHLDAQYAGFGAVVEGMSVVDKIASCKTGRYQFYTDVPRSCICISEACVLEDAQ